MVSVIVPVFNTARYLPRCLDALVNQTIDKKNLEIVLVNDGSTDGSCKILQEYKDRYPDIITLVNKENGGQATARNLGIKIARGEYVGFADSDDYVDTTLFEKLYDLAISENADLVECHYHSMLETLDKNGNVSYKEIGTRGSIKGHSDTKELFLNPQVSPWNKLYRKSILIDNDITFPEGMIYEDTSFYVKTLPFIKKQAYCDEKLVYYNVRQKSTMTSHTNSKVGDIFGVMDDILDFYHIKGIYHSFKDELEFFCVKIAFCSNLSRVGRVKSKSTKNELLDKTFDFVNSKFPYYRNNKYFKGKIGLYIRSVNRLDSPIYSYVLSKVMVG